jgi:bacterioferritin (cytochrome b1)
MFRREFLELILFVSQAKNTLKNIFQDSLKTNKEIKDKISKIAEYVKNNGEYTSALINKDFYKYYELIIPNKYRLQANDEYFSIIKYHNNSSLYDFDFDGIPDVYIKEHKLSEEDIINNLECALNAKENKKSKNKNLEILKNNKELNNLFEKDLNEIYFFIEN